MCTYNGARYLPELLDSLERQSVAPDEIVVSDDASEDGTWALVESFAAAAKCPVRLVRSTARRGINANFEQAVSLAAGDVLMLCDQDDVWQAEKIAVVRAAFGSSDTAGTFHNCSLMDAAGNPLPHDLWERAAFSPRDRARLNDGGGLRYLIRHPRIAGHTMAFHASRKSLVLPFSTSGPYDPWLSRLLVASGRLVPIERLLVRHRLHESNAVGVWRSRPVGERLRRGSDIPSMYRADAVGLRELALRLEERLPAAFPARTRLDLEEKVSHLERRAALIESAPASHTASALTVATELVELRYHRYSNGLSSAGYDLARVLLSRGTRGARGDR